MTREDQKVLRSAAMMLRVYADGLKAAFMVRGQWVDVDFDHRAAHREYDKCIERAKQLHKIANRNRGPNRRVTARPGI